MNPKKTHGQRLHSFYKKNFTQNWFLRILPSGYCVLHRVVDILARSLDSMVTHHWWVQWTSGSESSISGARNENSPGFPTAFSALSIRKKIQRLRQFLQEISKRVTNAKQMGKCGFSRQCSLFFVVLLCFLLLSVLFSFFCMLLPMLLHMLSLMPSCWPNSNALFIDNIQNVSAHWSRRQPTIVSGERRYNACRFRIEAGERPKRGRNVQFWLYALVVCHSIGEWP